MGAQRGNNRWRDPRAGRERRETCIISTKDSSERAEMTFDDRPESDFRRLCKKLTIVAIRGRGWEVIVQEKFDHFKQGHFYF